MNENNLNLRPLPPKVRVLTKAPEIWLIAKRAIKSADGTVRFFEVFRSEDEKSTNSAGRFAHAWSTSELNLQMETAVGIEVQNEALQLV